MHFMVPFLATLCDFVICEISFPSSGIHILELVSFSFKLSLTFASSVWASYGPFGSSRSDLDT